MLKANWTPLTIFLGVLGIVGGVMAFIGGVGVYNIGFDSLFGVESCDYRKAVEDCGTGWRFIKEDLSRSLALVLAGKPAAIISYVMLKKRNS